MIKHKNSYYCQECYNIEFGQSQYRQAMFAILDKIFDLSDYSRLPRFINLQIEKYIRDYNFTEEGIYRTLCYIYFEYDFNDLNFKYGIYPVVVEYDLHHDFTFKKQTVKPHKRHVVKINSSKRNRNNHVIPKIKSLELN